MEDRWEDRDFAEEWDAGNRQADAEIDRPDFALLH